MASNQNALRGSAQNISSDVGLRPVAESRRGLEIIFYGCLHLLRLTCSLVVREPSIDVKLRLSHLLWALAQVGEAIGRRQEGLHGSEAHARPPNPEYIGILNEIVQLSDPEVEVEALMTVAIPDLHAACARQWRAADPLADEGTQASLAQAKTLLEPWLGRAPQQAAPTRWSTAIRSAGGLLGLAADARSGDVKSALPEIPQRPAREPSLAEAAPGEDVAASGYGAVLHDSIFRVELAALEICAALIAHHQDAPWGLVYDLAKQARDEARHFELFEKRMNELGVERGDFAIHYDVWDKFVLGRNLVERLIIEQRLGEGNGLDGAAKTVAALREAGDIRSAIIFDYITSDEIVHVRNGNKWLRALLVDDESVIALEERLLDRLASRSFIVKNKHPINIEDRQLAGFTHEEIALLERKHIAYRLERQTATEVIDARQ